MIPRSSVCATTQKIRGRVGSPALTPSGTAHLQLPHPGSALLYCKCRTCSLLSAAAGGGQGQLSCFDDPTGLISFLFLVVRKEEGGGYLSHVHTISKEMSGRASSPRLLSSGPAHPQLWQCAGPTLPGWELARCRVSSVTYRAIFPKMHR